MEHDKQLRQNAALKPREPLRAATPTGKQAITVFFSYSHRDERLRNELEKHLSTLKRSKRIAAWHDRKIIPGEPLDRMIDTHLETADMILLLISADFLDSEYCYSREMQHALQRHAAGTARVVPIIVRPTVWQDAPIGRLLALPKDGKPVVSWSTRDQAWVHVATEIRRTVDDMIGPLPPARPTRLAVGNRVRRVG